MPGPLTVVGVAANVQDEGASAPPGETVYIPWAQLSTTTLSLVVRPRGSDDAAISAVRHALRITDPLLVAHDVAPLDALVDQANALPRLQSIILLTFAVAAIVMAMLGCYGVMRQLVATREREYAMRLVFGASPAELGRSVLRQVARLTVPGVVVGLLAVILLGGLLKRFVFGVDPRSGGGSFGGEPGDARHRSRGRAALGDARDARGRAAQHHTVKHGGRRARPHRIASLVKYYSSIESAHSISRSCAFADSDGTLASGIGTSEKLTCCMPSTMKP